MIRPLPYLVTATALSGTPVATDYARQPQLRTVVEVELDAAVTEFEMTVDGEPVRGNYPGIGSSSRLERRIVQLDEFLENDAGRPTRVRRTFEELHEHETHEAEGDDEDFDEERDCPLSGVTLELETDDDGDVSTTLVDGTNSGSDELLEGHLLALPLDALLLDPDEEVEVGDSWELDDDAVRRALGLDVVQALFPPAGREDAGPRRRAFAAARVLRNAEWEGEVRFVEDDATFDDLACARFEVELEASGELPEMSFGRRRDRAFGLRPPAPDNSFEIELEGELWFALEEGRPVHLELEGRVVVQRSAERERGGHEMVMTSTREGTLRQEVTITAEDEDR